MTTRLTADQIAALFAERVDGTGTARLTRRQVQWLHDTWEREVRPPTEQRHLDGHLIDSDGKVTHFWTVDILRNGAGILRLTLNDFEEKARARLTEIAPEIEAAETWLAQQDEGNTLLADARLVVTRHLDRLKAERERLESTANPKGDIDG